MKTISIETVAQICHAANVIFSNSCCELKVPQTEWEKLGEGIKKKMISAIDKIQSGEISTPLEAHNNWMRDRRAAGWVWGLTKDEVNKTHPCLVEYEELPEDERIKDDIFFSIVYGLLERDVEILFPEPEETAGKDDLAKETEA